MFSNWSYLKENKLSPFDNLEQYVCSCPTEFRLPLPYGDEETETLFSLKGHQRGGSQVLEKDIAGL